MIIMSEETDSPGGQDSSEESTEDIQGVSEKNAKLLNDFIAKLKKVGVKPTEQENQEEEEQTDPEEEPESESTIKELSKRITELEKDKTDYEDSRKKDLLSELNDKDQVKYKDKSLEAIELIVGYIRDNPKRGISKTPKSTNDSKTQSQILADGGSIGSYDPITKKWVKK